MRPRDAGLTVAFTAPEVFQRRRPPDRAACTDLELSADIYALGIVLFETMSQTRAWTGRTDEAIEAAVVAGARPVLPEETRGMYGGGFARLPALMVRCWSQEPRSRPRAHQVLDELRRNKPF